MPKSSQQNHQTSFFIWVCVAAVAATLTLSGCAQPDSDKVADAQDCLDRSTAATALACLSKVEGLTSSSAELIRCSAYFIDQGFSDAERLAAVAEQLNSDDGNSGDATMNILSFMAFSNLKYTMPENFSLSETSFSSCAKSNSPGLIYLSSLTRIATAALNILPGYDPASGVAPTEAQIRSVMCQPGGPPEATSIVIGAAAQTAFDQNCKGKDISKDEICMQYQTAVNAGSTPAEVGASLAAEICAP